MPAHSITKAPPRPAPAGAANTRKASHPMLGALAAGGAVGVLMWLRMFVPSPIGMADNGDGLRLMCQVGVSPHVPHGTKLYDAFAILNYGADPHVAASCVGYPSSTVYLMRFDKWVSELLGLHATLDLRVSMALYCVIVAVATVALCRLIGPGWWRQGLAAAVLLLIAGDATFADYMGSPMTETAGIIALVVLPIAAVFAARSGPVWTRCVGLVVFAVSAAILVSAKVQAITIVVPVLAFLAWLALRGRRATGRSLITRWSARIALAGACLVAAGTVVVPAAETYSDNPPQFAVINPTEVIFGAILDFSSDPVADLKEMGLPAEFARYAGHTWWSSDPPQNDPLFDAYKPKMTYGTIASFLLHHPDIAVEIANDGAQQFFAARPTYLGSYQPGHASPRDLEQRISVLSNVMQAVAWMGMYGFLLLTVATALLAARLARRRRRGSAAHSFAVVSLLCNGICLAQYVTATYGEAVETTKHLVFGVMAALFCGGLLICAAIASIRERTTELSAGCPTSEGRSDPQPPTATSLSAVVSQ